MQIGDKVLKKSGKPFQDGKKTAIIESFTTMTISLPNKHPGTKEVEAVYLVGCIGPIRFSQLGLVTQSVE